MSLLSQEQINEIRNSVDIANVISNYIALTPRGKNFFGVCPFHDDNNPSLSVSTDKKIYKCFSCGATGTVFKFIMDYENVSFLESVKKVADIAGINVDVGKTNKVSIYPELHKIYDLSLKFYMNNINTAGGKAAKEYLKQRDINEEIIKEFQIGLALDNNEALTKILIKKFEQKDLLKTGLLGKTDYGFYDLFQSRIMFPLYDLNGQVVGYSGRIYNKEDNSKYINTRETEIFKKGELLYNYHKAKDPARRENVVIVVEGFMDVIRMHTIDIKNVVATMGTATTINQANLIKKMAKEVIICFDGDKAGAKATMSLAEELIKIGVTPKVVRLEDGLDPDEYIKKHGKEHFHMKLDNPINILDFKLSYLKEDRDITNTTEMAKYVNDSIKEIEKTNDEILQDLYIKKLAEETNVTEELIRKKITKKEIIPITKEVKEKTDKYEVAQRNLINYMLKSPEVIKMYDTKVTYIPNKEYRLLAREISSFYKNNGFINIADLIDYVECDKDLLDTIAKIEKAALKDDYTVREIEDYIMVIKSFNIKNETIKLTKEMKEELDLVKKAQIAQKIIDLKKESSNV